jgi:hypothetical protein
MLRGRGGFRSSTRRTGAFSVSSLQVAGSPVEASEAVEAGEAVD